MACQSGGGCYRSGWGLDRRIDIAEFDCAVVFVNSCLSFKLAGAQTPRETHLALRAVQGEPVAYIGTPWTGTNARFAADAMLRLVGRRVALGEALAEVNRCMDHACQMGRYCLLGDPTLTLGPRRSLPTQHVDDTASLSLAAGGVVVLELASHVKADHLSVSSPDLCLVNAGPGRVLAYSSTPEAVAATISVGSSVEDLMRERHGRAVEHLRFLPFLGVESHPAHLRRLEGRLLECAELLDDDAGQSARQRSLADEAAAIEAELRVIDRQVAECLLERLRRSFFQLHERYQSRCRQVDSERCRCEFCANPEARRHLLQHRSCPSLVRAFTVCPHCGETRETPVDAPFTFEVDGPHVLRRGERFEQRLVITSRANWELAGSIAYSVLAEDCFATETAQVQNFVVAPGERATVVLAGKLPSQRLALDLQRLRFYMVCGGQISLLQKNVWVVDGDASG